jgi:hypothetical protein
MDRYYEIARNRDDLAGKEISEVTPVVLGGSSTDPANKVVLDRDEHIKVVVYWNRVIREMRARDLCK